MQWYKESYGICEKLWFNFCDQHIIIYDNIIKLIIRKWLMEYLLVQYHISNKADEAIIKIYKTLLTRKIQWNFGFNQSLKKFMIIKDITM